MKEFECKQRGNSRAENSRKPPNRVAKAGEDHSATFVA